MEDYNDLHEGQKLNIVLFNSALDHLCRLMRILKFPGGHALLIGYGGSGKQTITKLASYTAKMNIFKIQLKKHYGEKEFYEDLFGLYNILCSKKTVFMFTDSHVKDESFLEPINNMLTIGIVPSIFDEEKKTEVVNIIKPYA